MSKYQLTIKLGAAITGWPKTPFLSVAGFPEMKNDEPPDAGKLPDY
jgi:hypothetical protein